MKVFASWCALLAVSVAVVDGTVDAGITTRSVEATGRLRCGLEPAAGVKVTLKREEGDDLNNIIGQAVTDNEGRFTVHGNTERFGGAQSTIDPILTFYHKCLKGEKAGFESFHLRFPRTYTTIGKVPRRQYDLGTYNLEIKYPGQKEEKNPPV